MTTTGEVNNLATRVATETKALRTLINGNLADLSALTTTDKTSVVAAINELVSAIGGAGAVIDDGTISALTVWSSDKTNDEIVAAVTAVIGGAPGALDTLNELAAAINDDASYAATLTSALGLKAPLASPTFTGTPAAPTAAAATSTTQLATTAHVQAAITARAASAVAAGIQENATDAETITGSVTDRTVTPANLLATLGNSATNFVTTFEAGLV